MLEIELNNVSVERGQLGSPPLSLKVVLVGQYSIAARRHIFGISTAWGWALVLLLESMSSLNFFIYKTRTVIKQSQSLYKLKMIHAKILPWYLGHINSGRSINSSFRRGRKPKTDLIILQGHSVRWWQWPVSNFASLTFSSPLLNKCC